MTKTIQYIGLCFLLVAPLFLGAFPAQAAPLYTGPADLAEVEAFFDGLMAAQMQANHIPGAVVSIVKDGQLFFAKGYGYADLEQRIPVDPQRTLFRPGSVSKLFVWTSVMQLVEQGRLDLDADVNEYLDFTIPATYPKPITLRNLLSHTPGFEDRGEGLFKISAESMDTLDGYLKAYLPARVFPPGELGAYSNYGTALAGYIVERVSGKPFYAYVEQNIFQPLGMTHSTFRQPLPAALAGDMAQGYNYVNGEYLNGGFEYVNAYPAGALSASATDMAKFMIAHLQDGRFGEAQILQAATAQQMQSDLFSHDPRLDGMAYGFFENTVNGLRIFSHGGDTILFHTLLFLIPEKNVGVFVSTNGVGGAGNGEAVAKAFLDRYYPVAEAPDVQPPAGFAERIAPYLGEYFSTRSNFTTVEKLFGMMTPVNVSLSEEGYLLVSSMGETSQYVEIEPGLLQNREQPASRVIYRTDEHGQQFLLPAEPFGLMKAPWYAGMVFNGLLFVASLLLSLGALAGWLIGFFKWLRRREQRPWGAALARLVAVSFSLVLLIFVVIFAGLMSDVDPALATPRMFFERLPILEALMRLPWVMAAAAFAMPVFAVLAWWKRYWTGRGRIHYTVLTLSALSVVWMMAYWNLL